MRQSEMVPWSHAKNGTWYHFLGPIFERAKKAVGPNWDNAFKPKSFSCRGSLTDGTRYQDGPNRSHGTIAPSWYHVLSLPIGRESGTKGWNQRVEPPSGACG